MPTNTGMGQPYAYGPGVGSQTGYDPFNPMYLYAPMANQMDQASEIEAAKLNERFGAQGGRWSTPLMTAQAGLLRQGAQDKQGILSKLMYQGAQDQYGRQQDAANMGLQLGQAQTNRDTTIAQMLSSMGLQESTYADTMLSKAYQEWIRQQGGYTDQLAKLMGSGNGYNTDFLKDPGFAEKYGGWASMIAALLANY